MAVEGALGKHYAKTRYVLIEEKKNTYTQTFMYYTVRAYQLINLSKFLLLELSKFIFDVAKI